MIVKGTRQIGSFKRGINLYVPKKVTSQAEQVIWKVAIFGAGTTSSNGEYVWDGTTLFNGKPQYFNGSSYIYNAEGSEWSIYDATIDESTFNSLDNLETWESFGGFGTAPSSALSYAQDSFISSITLSNAGTTACNGTYTRSAGGIETFIGQAGTFYNFQIVYYDDGGFFQWFFVLDGNEESLNNAYQTASVEPPAYPNLFNWSPWQSGLEPAPIVSAASYSA